MYPLNTTDYGDSIFWFAILMVRVMVIISGCDDV